MSLSKNYIGQILLCLAYRCITLAPAHLKAYIDHIVRMNKTYSFDLSKEQPYSGLLDHQKTMIILSARGGHDFDSADAPFPNHAEPAIKTAFNFIGIRKNFMKSQLSIRIWWRVVSAIDPSRRTKNHCACFKICNINKAYFRKISSIVFNLQHKKEIELLATQFLSR